MNAPSSNGSLQHVIDNARDLVWYFRNKTTAPHNRNRPGGSPVTAEFTNWREEQRAWRETAVLFDQSHHMPELFLGGSDAQNLLSYLGVNSFKNFAPGRAKQFVCCNNEGYVIGECVLIAHDGGEFELVSGMHLQDWVAFNAETGDWDVTVRRDPPTAMNSTGRTKFRFGMDGPNAESIFNAVLEVRPPELAFFRTAKVCIAGCEVLAMRHGMAGHKGVELSGAYEDGQKVREALIEIGHQYGLRQGGRLAYFSAPGEGGWLAYPLPAIYTDPALRAFREWLPADCWGAKAQLSGSMVASRISDYYVTPFEIGLGKLVNFEHEFVGREALALFTKEPQRKKVTLIWNAEDVARIQGSLFEHDLPYRYIEFPVASYGFPQADEVRLEDGTLVGMAGYAGYSSNEKCFLSLAVVEENHAVIGKKLKLIWGEPDSTEKPQVERHRQYSVRVTVAPAPFSATVQRMTKESVKATAA